MADTTSRASHLEIDHFDDELVLDVLEDLDLAQQVVRRRLVQAALADALDGVDVLVRLQVVTTRVKQGQGQRVQGTARTWCMAL